MRGVCLFHGAGQGGTATDLGDAVKMSLFGCAPPYDAVYTAVMIFLLPPAWPSALSAWNQER